MSKIIPEESTLVVLGSWNPAIFQPKWLRQEFPSLIPEKMNIQVLSSVVPSMRFDLENIILEPTNNRLLFAPKMIDAKTIKYIADLSNGIRDRLNHTPIIAAGCNFVFKLEEDEYCIFDKIDTDEQMKTMNNVLEKCTLSSKSMIHIFSAENHTININYSFQDRILRLNFEYREPVSNAMRMVADSLLDNFKQAQTISEALIRTL